MAFSDPITLAWDAGTVTMNRINQDNFGAVYYGTSGVRRFTLTVKHTIPSRGAFGESHLLRLDVEVYDANGVLLRTSSAWAVVRTDSGIQDQEESEDATEALVDFLSDANITKLVSRQS
jgi:hypothetical protein